MQALLCGKLPQISQLQHSSETDLSENSGSPGCDIVLPVHNALSLLADCLDSIESNTAGFDYRLLIVDDCSDEATQSFIRARAGSSKRLTVLRNDENLGFVKSVNIGLRAGSAPLVAVVNSDVILPPRWLERLIECADSDPAIATVNPLTNRAAHIQIPMPPGANFLGVDSFLSRASPRLFPDVVTGVGFCMLIRRDALEAVGPLDEVYGHGYCEDSDLCMRLTSRGRRTVVADHVYVLHKGSGSFTARDRRYLANRKIFDRRWGAEYRRQFRRFRSADPLKPVRALLRAPRRWAPVYWMRETYRKMRDRYRDGDLWGSARAAAGGLLRLPRARRIAPDSDLLQRTARPGKLRITYVLEHLTVAGGVLSVVQLANELVLLGAEGRIAAVNDYPEVRDWRLLTEPMIFRNPADLVRRLPQCDIAVATHWTTAAWVAEAVRAGRAGIGAYFIQDYESWCYPPEDRATRDRVKASYGLITNRIVKSDWLAQKLAQDGYEAVKIPLGMDLRVFYPRQAERSARPAVLAMARPRTARRGFDTLIDTMRHIRQRHPEARIILFGDDLRRTSIPFEHEDHGVVTRREELARLYSQADVFIDSSHFQGFGRTGLEAMACGAACVLTNVGGVNEYAEEGVNCLLAPPRDPQALAEAACRVLENPDLAGRLVRGGLETAKAYCHKEEAKRTLRYFRSLAEG